MSNIVLTFPLYKKSAMVVGFSPYSHIGYKFEEKENRPEIISEMGDVVYKRYGEGGMNQLFLGAGMMVSKNFSAGIQGYYYFGSMYKNSDVYFGSSADYSTITTHNNAVYESFSGKLGVQYSGKINNKFMLSAGATVLLPANLKGDVTQLASVHTELSVDTAYFFKLLDERLKIPAEFAVGLSLRKKYFEEAEINKWMVGFDFSYQDWSKTLFASTPGVDFKPSKKSACKLGFEYTPNFFDPRYPLKRWTYRGGAYYERSYMQLNGQQINAVGFTLGVSLPVFRWSNMLNFGIDVGQRGSLAEQLVRERYVMFNLSISLYDVWFLKMKYE
jgi:hypothetical protein